VVDFEMKKPVAIKLDEISTNDILYDINGFTNISEETHIPIEREILVLKDLVTVEDYKKKFETVFHHLEYGDTYIANLTIESGIQLKHSLRDVFQISSARYKLWYKNEFIVFSPEIFVQMREGKIFSYPMKGTIDATVPDAKNKILNDKKELAEHVTIVDLIRNDLSQVANNVKVRRFRYIDELKTNTKTLLQVSSESVGVLNGNYKSLLGDILVSLLPAGSVSGAPKSKTVEVLRHAEGRDRGYYTGVFGYFDGVNFDSGVMIRFIERRDKQFVYRSGGGITTQSLVETEYLEAIDKVYVPIN
jgi:para-aminobenzoate synthetase component 1